MQEIFLVIFQFSWTLLDIGLKNFIGDINRSEPSSGVYNNMISNVQLPGWILGQVLGINTWERGKS